MKKILTLTFALVAIVTGIKAQDILIDSSTFPDENFRNYLIKNIKAAKDGIITQDEIKGVTTIVARNEGINSMKGIELFTELTYLEVSGNNLTELDLSKNTKLWDLYCMRNKLTSLILPKDAPDFTYIECNENNLTELNVATLGALEYLGCANNKLTSLTLPVGSLALQELSIYGNDDISISELERIIVQLHEATYGTSPMVWIGYNFYDYMIYSLIKKGWKVYRAYNKYVTLDESDGLSSFNYSYEPTGSTLRVDFLVNSAIKKSAEINGYTISDEQKQERIREVNAKLLKDIASFNSVCTRSSYQLCQS